MLMKSMFYSFDPTLITSYIFSQFFLIDFMLSWPWPRWDWLPWKSAKLWVVFLVLPLPRWAASPTVVSCPEQMTVARNRPFGAARVRSKLINVTKPFSADHIQQLAVTRPSSPSVGWNVIKIFSTGILAAQYSEKRWGGFISSFSCGGWSPVVLADLSASLKLLSATESRSLSNGTSSQWH